MRTRTILFCLLCSLASFAQGIQFDCPQLAGKRMVSYFATAEGRDSISTTLDNEGKGEMFLADYQGLIQVGNSSAGFIEILYTSTELPILKTHATQFELKSVSIENSPENDFLRQTLLNRAQFTQQLQWLSIGQQLYPQNTDLQTLLNTEKTQAESSLQQIKKELTETSLSAPRYIRLMDFAQKLTYVAQARDKQLMNDIKQEMEEWLDVDALSHSLSLQDQIFRGYLSLYGQVQNGQEYYAQSIFTTLDRLEEPLRQFYLKNSLMLCEQAGWKEVQGKIWAKVLDKWAYYGQTEDASLKRMLDAYTMQHGKVKMSITGLAESNIAYDKTLLFFYESDCELCLHEIEILKKEYQILEKRAIRIVSISADRDKELFDEISKTFPWKDTLCDRKGAMGENFSRFGVMTTPNYVLLDKEGLFEKSCMRLERIK